MELLSGCILLDGFSSMLSSQAAFELLYSRDAFQALSSLLVSRPLKPLSPLSKQSAPVRLMTGRNRGDFNEMAELQKRL